MITEIQISLHDIKLKLTHGVEHYSISQLLWRHSKLSSILWNQKVHYLILRTAQSTHILGLTNPVHFISSYSSKTISDIIRHPTSWSWSFLLNFSLIKYFVHDNQNCWIYGSCRPSGVLNLKNNILETGSVSIPRWVEEDAYYTGTLIKR
jgi:hypothetical protein